MISVTNYAHFGGRHSESAALKNLMDHAGVVDPHTGAPLSEALCFAIAGGIGAGYSFCPSMIRDRISGGVAVVGRHKVYTGDGSWYREFFGRIGAETRISETSSRPKAFKNLADELSAGRPAVVWCSQGRVPFLGMIVETCDLWMHSFVVHAIDESTGQAWGADLAPTSVSLSLDALAEARDGVCTHKNRTLTFAPPKPLSKAAVKEAALAGLRACAGELNAPRIKTFSLPGLEILAKMINNGKAKEGWLKVYDGGLLSCALRDVFDSIETSASGTGGDLYRGLFADALEEAAAITGRPALDALADDYRALGRDWSALADAALPDRVTALKQTKTLLRTRRRLFEEEGERGAAAWGKAVAELRKLDAAIRARDPLAPADAAALLNDLAERVQALHRAESEAAAALQKAVA